MRRLSKPTDDPLMRKLVALVQQQLPFFTHHARIQLLEQLRELEQQAMESEADPGTLRSIHATQHFVSKCEPLLSIQRT